MARNANNDYLYSIQPPSRQAAWPATAGLTTASLPHQIPLKTARFHLTADIVFSAQLGLKSRFLSCRSSGCCHTVVQIVFTISVMNRSIALVETVLQWSAIFVLLTRIIALST